MFPFKLPTPFRRYFFPVILLGVLIGYLWVGYSKVPFHGDEADHLFKSHDFMIAIVQGHPEKLKVTPPVNIDSPEHIRLLTGTTTALVTGYALWSSGYTSAEWPGPWYYAQDVAWNLDNGRLPRQDILKRGRVATTLLGMLSIPMAFGIVWMIFPLGDQFKMWAASGAAFLVTTHPSWLLNSRRVMQEAALGSLSLAVLLCGMMIAKQPQRWKLGVLVITSGLCLAAKPTGAITVGSVWAALGLIALRNRIDWRQILWLIVAGILTIGVYILMTPAIWGSPFSRIKLATELRAEVLKGQTKASSDSYDSRAEQWLALIQEPFLSDLQYFESPAFEGYLDEQIADYENAHLDGWQMPRGVGMVVTGIAGIGFGTLLLKWREPIIQVVMVWVMGVGVMTGVAVPLAWQRYYLVWSLGVCLLASIGLGKLLSLFDTIAHKYQTQNTQLVPTG